MDITSLSASMSRLSTDLNFTLMSKVLDTTEDTAEAMIEMLAVVPTPGLGEHIDIHA